MNSPLKSAIATLLLVSFVSACGGGGSGDDDEDLPVNDDVLIPTPTPTPTPTALDNFDFRLGQDFTDTNNADFVQFLGNEFSSAVAPLNQIDNVFNNVTVPVTYDLCGFANAFYTPDTRQIVICDEFTEASFGIFLSDGTTDEDLSAALTSAIGAVTFVTFHEIGHALDDLTNVVIGGNFESAADAIGVVLSVQIGEPLSAILGAFVLSNSAGSFSGVHGSGIDRAGDITCWATGSSSRVAAVFPELVAGFNAEGRDCVGEYTNQVAFVERLVPDLRNVPPKASLRSKSTQSELDMYTALDKIMAARLKNL